MADAISNQTTWFIQKYARLRSTLDDPAASTVTRSRSARGQWTMYGTKNNDLKLTLTNEQVIITKGNLILESFFLLNAKSQCKAMTKGDSILFVSQTSNGVRVFRIKFETTADQNNIQQCQHCVGYLAKFITFSNDIMDDINNEMQQQEPIALSNTIDISQMVKAMLHPKDYNLPMAYSTTPSDNNEGIEDAVAFCLADPLFPTFVETVENVMKEMLSDDDNCNPHE